jgi:hypothetical protein
MFIVRVHCMYICMYVTTSTKIRMSEMICHLLGLTTSFDIMILSDWCSKTVLWRVCCFCYLQLPVFPYNQSVLLAILIITSTGDSHCTQGIAFL